MKLIDEKVSGFVARIDSKSATPGGGSVAALSGTLGAALVRMVGHLTIEKKKFKELNEEIKTEYINKFEEYLKLQIELEKLIDKDTDAYNEVMNAFKLPKETSEEKKARRLQIEKATYLAIEVPEKTALLAYEGLKMMKSLIDYSNKNAISDLGVGAILLFGTLEGAILNIKTNLTTISDEGYVEEMLVKCIELEKDGEELKKDILSKVEGIFNL